MHVINVILTAFLIIVPTLYLVIALWLLKKDIKDNWLHLGFLILLSVVFLNKLLFTQQTLAAKDFNNIQVPMFQFFSTSIRSYFLPPIWNNSFSGGFDVFESPLSSYFSAFNWVFVIGSNVYKSFGFFILAQICLCAVFSYLMLRTFQFKKTSALLGAVLFTFNGFVVMRLSEGLGIEYLYTYKWLPLVLLATNKYLDQQDKRWLILLAISLAMLFEGNTNIVVSTVIMWLLYLFTEYRNSVKFISKFIGAGLLAVAIYAVKLVPFIDLALSNVSRFTNNTSGWRQGNIDWEMFPRILFPVQFNFNNAIVTPGVVGMILVLLGFLISMIFLVINRKPAFIGFYFAIVSLIFALFSTIEGPLYNLFYSLPVLNKLTQIPTFLIFYIIPFVLFGSYFVEKLTCEIEKTKIYSKLPLVGVIYSLILPMLVFTEVLLGPSTFGNKTFSFNFAKMNISETYDFPHYKLLAKQPRGLFIFPDNANSYIFLYPYGITQANLITLNGYHYFYGSLSEKDLVAAGLNEVKTRADYIISLNPVENDPDLRLLGKVSMSKTKDFRSFAVYANLYDYQNLYSTGWNDDLYIYKVTCVTNCALKNYSQNPVEFPIFLDSNDTRATISTSIAYSRWLHVTYQGKEATIGKDPYGYLTVKLNPSEGGADATFKSVRRLYFEYINPYIYFGFAVSLGAFVAVIAILFKAKKTSIIN
jgi:hypothetical protein